MVSSLWVRSRVRAPARAEAARHPLIQAVLAAFPGAIIDEVRDLGHGPAAEPLEELGALPQADAAVAEEPTEDEIA